MYRILIAEDEVKIAAFMEKGFKKQGFVTAVAEDGPQALSLATESEFDLLLLDLGLPAIDGMTVLKELRNRGEQRPIIVVTARTDRQELASALASGASECVTKPFSFSDLLSRVRSHLEEKASCFSPT
ncbi:MAG: response regulator transcription factor [Oscillatoriales cyanobacterium RU_3_3]|nr:response regulator transcription factor [Microcoleus sp. SU_5_3]NJL67914.1 response regulator transcription factor [Microcoleus sp. SM1_3_4]NJM61659.1 response regulator transcription factor [Oscillatoriales cyanobacterium RU_3_3]NJR22883.1 response regulator transcription factor [Richelia sp. CSU_2_1]